MNKQFQLFNKIGDELVSKHKAEISQMFGKPCLKIGGKAFACFFHDEMVFKLGGEDHEHALQLNGSQLFDPSGKKRPMKEWVQVPYSHSARWKQFAIMAMTYLQK